jgi:hypothetical protein
MVIIFIIFCRYYKNVQNVQNLLSLACKFRFAVSLFFSTMDFHQDGNKTTKKKQFVFVCQSSDVG